MISELKYFVWGHKISFLYTMPFKLKKNSTLNPVPTLASNCLASKQPDCSSPGQQAFGWPLLACLLIYNRTGKRFILHINSPNFLLYIYNKRQTFIEKIEASNV